MLFFDQLKKNDPQLRLLALGVLVGLAALLAGLWWVQIVSSKDYQAKLETQSFRSVRIPAVRGKILDRNGIAVADSQPQFNVSLYLEELRSAFAIEYSADLAQTRSNLQSQLASQENFLHRKLTRAERAPFVLTSAKKAALRESARYEVASNLVSTLSRRLQLPVTLDETRFQRHYAEALVLPLPVLENLSPTNIARFEEQSVAMAGLDLEMQPIRSYPFGTTAAHLLGQLQRDISSAEGEDSFLNYPLPVFRGMVGIEAAFDPELRGRSGSKSVLVNNLGYRQSESVWSPALAGDNVMLTIDLRIQQAAEKALASAMPNVKGAVVVMDPNNGDILAMASAPSYDPNVFARGVSPQENAYLNDERLRPQINRAVQDNYRPGSIFKMVISLAILESGIDPREIYVVEPNPADPAHGCINVGKGPKPQKFKDTAPPGEYDFRRAVMRSSNSYFITNGLRAGIENIVRIAQRFHFGERCGIPTRQEVPGNLPSLKQVRSRWNPGDTANICIGQGELDVTPLQMAVATAAIANGGKVLYPRLVIGSEAQDPFDTARHETFAAGRVRDELGVKPSTLKTLCEAMLSETEDLEGTGYVAFHRGKPGPSLLESLRVCGKTGTAQKENSAGTLIGYTVWFASFAPLDNPRYVVLVMVDDGFGISGGGTCAPVAEKIYEKLEELERAAQHGKTVALTN